MAKSLVEKYEQILAQDPASTVFVELAKALLEKGENDRTIVVCQQGLEHHPESVVGRVLWGKALINLGRPAEAMAQFDKAIAIDRSNPHAYNLIGEVLLHKGLYRSALPLLRKAVALQPNDGRVRQWLEQTQAALEGGPAPILSELPRVDLRADEDPAQVRTDVGLPALTGDAPAVEDSQPTVVLTPTPDEVESSDAPPTQVIPMPQPEVPAEPAVLGGGTGERVSTDVMFVPGTVGSHVDASGAAPTEILRALTPPEGRPVEDRSAPPVPDEDPFAAVPQRTPTGETIVGLTATFDALSQPAPEADLPSVSVSEDLARDGGGLLGDLPSTAELQAPPAPGREAPRAPSGGGLLGDIPDLDEEPAPASSAPRLQVSAQAAEAIGREYERELREKLAQSRAKKSFLSRHWLKLAAGGVLALALVVGGVVYVQTLTANQGSLADALAEAKKGLAEDTRASYRGALEALGRAARMDEDHAEVQALTARAHAALFVRHGEDPADRAAAVAALDRPGVREAHPGLALVIDHALADGTRRAELEKQILAASGEDPDLYELAGTLLLKSGDEEGGRRKLQAALELQPAHVRSLVAVGDYFRRSGDYANALEFYGRATRVSAKHPGAILGAAESRLQLGQELEATLAEVTALPPNEELPGDVRARRVLVQGNLLAATGKTTEAIDLLKEGLSEHRLEAYDFQYALGQAYRQAGRMRDAQAALEAALKLRAGSEEAKEAWARVLVARNRARAALEQIPANGSRRLSLVRGLAYVRTGDWKRARAELEKTQVDGRYPSEAVVLLALADAKSGQEAQAREALEKTLAVTKRARGEVLVALGQIHVDRGELDKARARFEEAAKEDDDPEGACAFGRMLLDRGLPQDAIAPLERAVARNDSHDEAHEALARAYLMLGRVEDALGLTQKWQEVQIDSASAQRMYAWALYQSGKLKEAETEAWRSIKDDGKVPETWRVRAAVNFAQGETKAAFAALEKANKLDPKDPETFCAIGRAFLRQGNTDHANAAFEASVRERPESACGRIGLLWAKLPAANREAVKQLEELARDSVAAWDRAFAQAALARAMLVTGKAKGARKVAEDAVKLAPWVADTHLALGLVAEKLRDTAGAKAALEKAVELDPSHSGYRLEYADVLARGEDEEKRQAVREYETFLRLGGNERDESRVKRTLTALKRGLASR